MTLRFKPEDFKLAATHCCGACACDILEKAQQIFDQWLKENGKVVYAADYQSSFWKENLPPEKRTSQALLINIEPIEKCTHPRDKVHLEGAADLDFYGDKKVKTVEYFKCECGQKMKPKEFEVCDG